jgi:CRP-like cAMP-binding protein
MEEPADFAFLRQAPLFRSLSDDVLYSIRQRGELLDCQPGHIIFEEGSPGFDLFVVKSGVLEVLKQGETADDAKVVSYLSTGDCVGEMSIITGLLRSATIRVQQRAEVFRISGQLFDDLLNRHPSIAVSLAKTLAYRLQMANQVQVTSRSGPKHLSGDLDFFDLSEVSQSLVQSYRTGLMRINAPRIDSTWLYFKDGFIRYARMGELTGRDAVLCIFRRRLKGTFEFQGAEDGDELAGEPPIEDAPLSLFLESARQRDEIEELRSRLPPDNYVFGHTGKFPWTEPDPTPVDDLTDWHPTNLVELDLAKKIWAAIAIGQALGDIIDEFFVEEHAVLKMLNALRRSNLVT